MFWSALGQLFGETYSEMNSGQHLVKSNGKLPVSQMVIFMRFGTLFGSCESITLTLKSTPERARTRVLNCGSSNCLYVLSPMVLCSFGLKYPSVNFSKMLDFPTWVSPTKRILNTWSSAELILGSLLSSRGPNTMRWWLTVTYSMLLKQTRASALPGKLCVNMPDSGTIAWNGSRSAVLIIERSRQIWSSSTVHKTLVMATVDHVFKIVLTGDSLVGKSSLLLQYSDDYFSEEIQSTIGN